MRIIGTNADGMATNVGEGVFGYGGPDGSLGHNAFLAPRQFANRERQGIFWQPYSYQWYETQEPELGWALERRPGLPRFPGSSAQGLVLIGPSMGSFVSDHPTLTLAAVAVGAFMVGCYIGKNK